MEQVRNLTGCEGLARARRAMQQSAAHDLKSERRTRGGRDEPRHHHTPEELPELRVQAPDPHSLKLERRLQQRQHTLCPWGQQARRRRLRGAAAHRGRRLVGPRVAG